MHSDLNQISDDTTIVEEFRRLETTKSLERHLKMEIKWYQ